MNLFVIIPLILVVVGLLLRYVRVVPQKSAYIVERLGKYSNTLTAGLHVLIPVVDRVAYKHTLKEQALDVPPQMCITQDNISVEVDGVLYLQVLDPKNASYGIDNYLFASIQIAQTTMRSIIGKLELDTTFEERDRINSEIVAAVDAASDPWGVKVTRYEVKNIIPPQSIKDAMEKQMRAEREKRATIAESEGEQQAVINRAEAERSELISRSEGEKQRRINEAEGRASEIEAVAKATAAGIREIAMAINEPGGMDAVNLRVAEQYLGEFGKIAKASNTMILPANMNDVSGVVATATKVFEQIKSDQGSK